MYQWFKRVVWLVIPSVLIISLTACSPLLHNFIPYEDEVYPEKVDNSPKPAEPVESLQIPKHIQQGRARDRDYYVMSSKREYQRREDLLIPPGSSFQPAK